MAEKILGEQGSTRRKRFLWVPALLIVCLALFVIGSAQAVHDIKFQLDGDALATTGGGPGGTEPFDWDSVFNSSGGINSGFLGPAGCGGPTGTPPGQCFDSAGFKRDFLPANPNGSFNSGDLSTFATGSKDTLNPSPGWQCVGSNNVTPKDTLLNVYSTQFIDSNGDQILYMGLERWANNGAGDVGFWFLQDGSVGCTAPDFGGSNTTAFTGNHQDGDILIVAEFSTGGTVTTINAFKWVGGSAGHLDTVNLVASGADCRGTTGPDPLCGTANTADITVPWPTTVKGGGSTLHTAEFFEAGLNLTSQGLGHECFNNVLADTRSSPSPTATLFDYAIAPLSPCQPNLTTTSSVADPTVPVQPGTAVHDTATVTVTGGANPPDATGTVTFHLCSNTSQTTFPDCTTGGTLVGTGTLQSGASTTDGISTATSPNVNCTSDAVSGCFVGGSVNPLANGSYCFRADWPGDSRYKIALSHTNQSGECFRVLQLTTTTATSPQSPAGTNITGNIALGTSNIVDHAVVSGSAAGGPPPGAVNFYICDPAHVTALPTPHCAGTGAAGDGTALTGNPVPLTAITGTNNSEATSSPAVTANALGIWCFRADYVPSGSVYTSSFDNSNGECFTVTTTSSATSAQNWLPNDHVVVSTATGATLSGTLDISLRSGTCTGTNVYQEPSPYDGSTNITAPINVDTTNGSVAATTFRVTAANAGTYVWRIVFTPTSSFATGFTKCDETSTVTINNGS